MELLFLNESIIYSAAFITFFALAFKFIKAKIIEHLRAYSKEVTHNMNEASHLLKEALGLFSQAEKDLTEAKAMAEKIIAAAHNDAATLIKETSIQLAEISANKTAIALARIAMNEKQLIDDIKSKIIESTFEKINQKLIMDLNSHANLQVINNGFSKVNRTIN